MTERRYSDTEVAAIFERASNAQQSAPSQLRSSAGMSLAELQEIGREVGIEPSVMAEAALAVTARGEPTAPDTFMGLPIGVCRTVELNRKLSEAEWERLVVDLRQTFNAHGELRSDGSLRQWTNVDMLALLEPTATGHRIRLVATRGNAARVMIGLGVMALAFAVVVTVLDVVLPKPPHVTTNLFGSLPFQFGMIAVALLASNALPLPRWLRLRRRQLEELATRINASAEATRR